MIFIDEITPSHSHFFYRPSEPDASCDEENVMTEILLQTQEHRFVMEEN